MINKIKKLISLAVNSNLVKQAGIYTSLNIIEKLIPFLVLPILARYLTKESLGYYIVYQTIISFMLPIISLNSDSSVLVNYYKLEKIEFAKYFFNSFYIIGLSLIFFSAIFIIFPASIAKLLEFPKELLIAIVFISFSSVFVRLIQNLWQVEKRPLRYGQFSISLTLTKDGLMLFFVVYFGLQFDGIIISQLIAYLIFLIVSIIILYRRQLLKPNFNIPYLTDSLKVGLPLTGHQIFAWLGNQSNRLLINIVLGSAATASFGIGSVYGSIVTVLQNSFNKAFVPHLFSELKSPLRPTNLKWVKFTYLYNLGLFIVAIFIGFVGYQFNSILFGEEYNDSSQFIFYIVIGSAFNGMYKMHVNYIFFTKETKYVMYITMYGGIVNVVLCYLLITLVGVLGAAQAFMISQLITYLLAWYYGNKMFPMPWFKLL